MNKALRISKSNELVEAGYRLSLNEQRIILCAIARIDARKPMPKGKLRVGAHDFAETFGIEVRHAYEALEDAAERLFERDVRLYSRDNKIREKFRWVYYVKYHDGEGSVTLGFSPEITPYLSLLHRRFTTYELHQVARLNSPYAIRLYEMLKRFSDTGQRSIALQKFKERLEIGSKYDRFSNLKARVVAPAVREINHHTDLEVEWHTTREGRRVVGLIFDFSVKPQRSLELG